MTSSSSRRTEQEVWRQLAQAFFSAKPQNLQLKVSEFFQRLDRDGDGTLTLHDLLRDEHVARSLALGCPSNRSLDLFSALDADGSGRLEWEECMTLYYLLTVRASRHCGGCGACILSLGYTCMTCFAARRSPHDTFDLCHGCYSSRGFSHAHDAAAFLDEHEMYNFMLLSTFYTSQQVQCKVCGDVHNKRSAAFLVRGKMHIAQDVRGADLFVCEWCLSWRCSKCGSFSRGQICSARPAQWLEESRFCNQCGGQKKSNVEFEKVIKDLKSLSLENGCETCRIKLEMGTLVSKQTTRTSSSHKKGFSGSAATSSVGVLDAMNTGLKSMEVGGKVYNALQQKDQCPLM